MRTSQYGLNLIRLSESFKPDSEKIITWGKK